jgi:hypothetical protein
MKKKISKKDSQAEIDRAAADLILELEKNGHDAADISHGFVYAAAEYSFFRCSSQPAIICNLIAPILHHFSKRIPVKHVYDDDDENDGTCH